MKSSFGGTNLVPAHSLSKAKFMKKSSFLSAQVSFLHCYKLAAGLIAGAVLLTLALATSAANFTTTVQQPGGQNWNGAIWNPGGVAPTAGNTYECTAGGGPTRIRNPTAGGIQTFPGDSLTLDTGSEIRAKVTVSALDFPGVSGNAGLILNGGNMDTGDNAVFTVTGVISVQAAS